MCVTYASLPDHQFKTILSNRVSRQQCFTEISINLPQELLQDLDDSHHKLESLNSNVDDRISATSQKEFQEMKEQVTQLEDRWAQFRKKLSASIEDNKRTIRRQKEFDQEHQKICAVLQTVLRGTDNTSLDQTDMAVNLERVEVGICLNVVRIFNFRFL